MYYQLLDHNKHIMLTEFAPSRAGVLTEYRATNEALGTISSRPQQQLNYDKTIMDYASLLQHNPQLKAYKKVSVSAFINAERGC